MNSDKEIIKELKSLHTQNEIDKLEKEEEIRTLKDQSELLRNVAVTKALQEQKSILDNTVAQKDLQIQNLNDAISRLERQPTARFYTNSR